MFNRNKAVISLTLIGLYAFAAPAGAATVAESGIASEVNSCVAAVREQLNYDGAARILHDVVAVERRTVGYTMKISTLVFGKSEGEVIRAYAATCVVNGDNEPLQFSISESS